MAAQQIIKRIENCIEEEVRKIKQIYGDFSSCLVNNTENHFEKIAEKQKILSEQIKDQSCSIFDLLDQLLYTIENWSSNHNHFRKYISYKKLINQSVTLKHLLNKYRLLLEHVAYSGEYRFKSINLRTKLTRSIEQLNLNSVLISKQPYVLNLNIYTIEQESIFRIKTDEIKFTLINYSDFDLDIVNVRLVDENSLTNCNAQFRTNDLLLSNLSLIDNQNLESRFNHDSECVNRIEWIAQNNSSNKKTFKVRVVYLMNNQIKNTYSNLVRYRFLIFGRFRNQIESQFYTDKFCLIPDADGDENNDLLMDLKEKFKKKNYYLESINRNLSDNLDLNQNNASEFEFNEFDLVNQSDENFDHLNSFNRDRRSSELKDQFKNNKLNEIDEFKCSNGLNLEILAKENNDLNIKLEQCIKRISNKFKNQKKYEKLFKFNEIEKNVLKERLVHSGNFHLSIDQLLNKELNYYCFNFSTYFRCASICYNLVDDNLREQIYGFLNRGKIIQLLTNSDQNSYLIVFSQSVLSTLVLNYLDDDNQLIELLFFEPNLRNDELNEYLKLNDQFLKFPILKN